MFNSGWLAQTIARAVKVVDHLDLQEGRKNDLGQAMRAVQGLASNNNKPSPRSRQLLSLYADLDKKLDDYCHTANPAMQTMSILYMLEKDFRRHFNKSDANAAETVNAKILLDISYKKVCVPLIAAGLEGGKDFFFDFRTVSLL